MLCFAEQPSSEVLRRLKTHERFTFDGQLDIASLEPASTEGQRVQWMLDVDGVQVSDWQAANVFGGLDTIIFIHSFFDSRSSAKLRGLGRIGSYFNC